MAATARGTAPLTLGDLVRIAPLVTAEAAVLPDPDATVEHVVLADTVDRLRQAAPHGIAVLHGEAATGGWSLAAAVHLAWERRVSAVVVSRAVSSTSSVTLAERLGVALLLVDADPVDLALELAARVGAPAAARAQRLATCAVLLTEQHSVRGVVGVLNAELAPVPVALVVGGSVAAGRGVAIAERPGTETVGVDVGGTPERPWARLVAAVPTRTPGAAEQVAALLRLARPPLTAVWAQSRLDVSAHAATEQAAFAMLRRIAAGEHAVTAPADDEVTAPAWSTELGWEVDAVNHAVWISPLRPAGDPPDELTHLVRTAWRRGRADRPLVAEGEGWVSWVSTADADDVTTLRRAVTGFRAAATAHGLVVGVGRGHPGIAGLLRSVAEARLAAHVARGDSAGAVQWFDQVGVPGVLAYLPDAEIAAVADLVLDALVTARDRLQLVTTVLAVLDCGGSLAQASGLLGVHRNTVLARLSRARQFGLAYDDPGQRLALHVLCHALVARWAPPAEASSLAPGGAEDDGPGTAGVDQDVTP